MKYILSILVLIIFISCKGKSKDKPNGYESPFLYINGREVTSASDSIQKLNAQICLQRGHIYTPVNNGLRHEFERQEGYIVSITQGITWDHDTTLLQLIDTPDSSYIVRIQRSDFKKCYRCGEDIEFKKPSIYVRTIWKKYGTITTEAKPISIGAPIGKNTVQSEPQKITQ